MATDARTEAQSAPKLYEVAEVAEAFEQREFSEDELEAVRKTRRGTPR